LQTKGFTSKERTRLGTAAPYAYATGKIFQGTKETLVDPVIKEIYVGVELKYSRLDDFSLFEINRIVPKYL
jgi:hypothetical protein